MTLTVDQRTVHFQRDDEALAQVDARREAWLEQQLDLARLFCRIDRKAAFVPTCTSSVSGLASTRGYHGLWSRELCQLGYALDAEPTLEQLLRDNEIGFQAACALGRIHQEPELIEDGDDWLHWACCERLLDLNRRIGRRVETARQGRRADVAFTAHVTSRTAAHLTRCRQLASQKAGVMLTNGQLLDVLSTGYLLEHDAAQPAGWWIARSTGPEEAQPAGQAAPEPSGRGRPEPSGRGRPEPSGRGRPEPSGRGRPEPSTGDVVKHPAYGLGSRARRLPPTSERPHDRTVPAAVARALEERSGGLCEFGGCDRPAMETCHLVPHREGSGREVNDLARGCRLHHKAYDAGLLRFLGWTRAEDPVGAGLPVFLAVETNEMLAPKPRPRPQGVLPPPAEQPTAEQPAAEQPTWLLRALGSRLRKRLAQRAGPRRRARRDGREGAGRVHADPPRARRGKGSKSSRAPPSAQGP